MTYLQDLYQLSTVIGESWIECEHIDWSEARQLANECNSIDSDALVNLPEIQKIINYAKFQNTWDPSEVSRWPDLIWAEIELANNLVQVTTNSHPDGHNNNATMSCLNNGVCVSVAVNLNRSALPDDVSSIVENLYATFLHTAKQQGIASISIEIGDNNK